MNPYLEKPKWLLAGKGLNEGDKDDFSALTDRKTIANIAIDICNRLRHPVTIMDINRIGNNRDSSDVRIDSDIAHFTMRESCRLFRHSAGNAMCHQCEGFHAALLKKVRKSESLQEDIKAIKSRIDEAIKKTPPFFSSGYTKCPPKVLEGYNRPIIEYHCPILGYRELIFPIYHDKEVIGVLLIGQAMVEEAGDRATAERIATEFFIMDGNTPDELFGNFVKYNGGEPEDNACEIKDVILRTYSSTDPASKYLRYSSLDQSGSGSFGGKSRQESMAFSTYEEYLDFISAACSVLNEKEAYLAEALLARKIDSFERSIRDAVDAYNKDNEEKSKNRSIQDAFARQKDRLETAWELLSTFVDTVKKRSGFKEILLFGNGVRLGIEKSRNKRLYPRPSKEDPRYRWSYDFGKIDDENLAECKFINSFDCPGILSGFDGKTIDRNNSILVSSRDITLLLLVEYLAGNEDLYRRMTKIIEENIARIDIYIALCASNLMKERYVLTLRMNRHEHSHISTLLSDSINSNFSDNGRVFIDSSREKRQLILEDMKSTIRLITYMENNVGVIIGSIRPESIEVDKSKINVFDSLSRWRVMFKNRLRQRNLEIVVSRYPNVPFFLSPECEDAPKHIDTAPHLFELLLYNLVDNAVKYAHRGSKIYLNWRKSSTRLGELSISNFGLRVPEDDTIYGLYVRGHTGNFRPFEGDGIGLHVVRQVQKLLKFENVSHRCVPVDERYHLPLMDWYIKEPFVDQASRSLQEKLQEHRYTGHAFFLGDVVNNSSTRIDRNEDLTQAYLQKHINDGTWLTTFTVCIPIQ
jgi:signal transduction histidine kinase